MSIWIIAGALLTLIVLIIAGPAIGALVIFATEDICFLLFGKRRLPADVAPRNSAATIVIPNWNGRDLLERFLPSVVAATSQNPGNEILVVDNASTDGSVEFLRRSFPDVRVLALQQNYGFGGGSNRGFQAAKNDIVVLLNNDMRVESNFLEPLLTPFSDSLVFSVSCQIFFSDPLRRREETGLTESWWERGRLRVSHRVDEQVQVPYPCAYPGGGSSAFDRRKFLELGGFDELLRPFYYEDTDLGHMAWKRGWKLLYQPASVVFHEHRGTIGRKFSSAFIESVLKKNVILYCWKNIHNWQLLLTHFAVNCLRPAGVWQALRQVDEAVKARWRARQLAVISDREMFRRQQGGYFRDRFQVPGEALPERPRLLFAAPYPIEPPVHGGAVFMKQAVESLRPWMDVHVVGFLDTEQQRDSQELVKQYASSAEFQVRHHWPPRNPSTTIPHAVREFWDRDFEWMIHRTIYLSQIDAVQLEYTVLGQYRGDFQCIPCFLFEHDIFFQALWRGMRAKGFTAVGVLEYMRMLRYEIRMLRRFTRVQVCSGQNADYLLQFAPELKDRLDTDLRTGIDTRRYPFVLTGREPNTLLFVGSFRHKPNVEGIQWFVDEVFPKVLELRPEVTLVVVGADAPDCIRHWNQHPNIRMAGFVDDVREPLTQCKVFIAPVLAGSGVRVKLLEAFASGIPVVSTPIGAEGLATPEMGICEIASKASAFAEAVVKLLTDTEHSDQLARRARKVVEQENDASVLAQRLAEVYRREIKQLRQ